MSDPTSADQKPRRAPLPPRWVIRAAWAIHRAIYRVTGGRRGLRPPTPTGWGMMRLTTTAAARARRGTPSSATSRTARTS